MKNKIYDVFLGLGGNQTNTYRAFEKMLFLLKNKKEVLDLFPSKVYLTTPVLPSSVIMKKNQAPYLNMVLKVQTTMSPYCFFDYSYEIYRHLGQKPREQNAPRLIDVDFLFYGDLYLNDDKLQIPHPRWKERLFVLKPLLDVTNEVFLSKEKKKVKVKEILLNFKNLNNEIVELHCQTWYNQSLK